MDTEIDPEIAAAMGFSSFGGPSKKRKFDTDEAITSANQNPSAPEEPQLDIKSPNHAPVSDVPHERAEGVFPARDNITLADGSTMSIQALRRGVRNERGDVAYFRPSFLEDPWDKLKPEKSTNP